MEYINKENEKDIWVEKEEESELMPTVNIRDYKFTTMGGDIQIRQFVDQLNEGDIEIPNIQRHYVWSPLLASRFIESALLDLPLPSVFLCKQKNGKYLIVDGLQRLTTLKMFLNMETVNGKTFKLSNSKDIYEDWRGKSFGELSVDDKRRLRNKTIHAIIVEQLNPENYDGLFLIFERINSGGLQLNQQEIRNAIYQTDYNTLLAELNDEPLWRLFFGDKNTHKRMKDIEMILRFFALVDHPIKNNETGTTSFVSLLNKQMDENKNADSEKMKNSKERFLNVLNKLQSFFNTEIFRMNISDKNKVTKKFYATLFDSIMMATDYALQINPNISSDITKLEELFKNDIFKGFINSHTSENKSIVGRIGLACQILYGINYAR